jgi:NADPH:quinone reductase-like Zn-dependent oxidoreductase
MHKIVVHKPGSYGRLCYELAESPSASPGHAVVRTASIGVNFADCVVRMGLYPSAIEYVGWPITPGFEFSGVIASLSDGDNPRGLKVGDEVFGVVRFGAYASEVEVPLNQLFPVPKGLSLVQAGVSCVATLTAWYALNELGAAKAGMKILVHSAAGGVGSTIVQMGKLLGCTVVGVVGSSDKVSTVRELGADLVVDKSVEPLFERARTMAPEGFDLVLDANGAQTMKKSYQALRPTGRLILYGAHTMLTRGSGRRNWLGLLWGLIRTPRFDPLDMINANKNVMAFNLSYLFDEQEALVPAMERISSWLSDGSLRIPQIQEYPLSDAAGAQAALQSGTTIGKLTLIP